MEGKVDYDRYVCISRFIKSDYPDATGLEVWVAMSWTLEGLDGLALP